MCTALYESASSVANRKKLISKNDIKNPYLFVCLDHGPDSRLWHAISMKDERKTHTHSQFALERTHIFYDLPNKRIKRMQRVCNSNGKQRQQQKHQSQQRYRKKQLTIKVWLMLMPPPWTHISPMSSRIW